MHMHIKTLCARGRRMKANCDVRLNYFVSAFLFGVFFHVVHFSAHTFFKLNIFHFLRFTFQTFFISNIFSLQVFVSNIFHVIRFQLVNFYLYGLFLGVFSTPGISIAKFHHVILKTYRSLLCVIDNDTINKLYTLWLLIPNCQNTIKFSICFIAQQ